MATIDDKFKIRVGERLKKLRKEKKMTQSAVIEIMSNTYYIDIDEKSLRRYERGEFLPKIDNLICLAEIFNTTLDYIIFGKELSDDNSYTWYDNFKRLNRLIYSLSLGMVQRSEDGKIFLELWDDEAKLYYERLQAFGMDKNYKFRNKNHDPRFSIKDLDQQFSDFQEFNEQLVPVTPTRYNKYLKSKGEDPEKFLKKTLEEIKSKREK